MADNLEQTPGPALDLIENEAGRETAEAINQLWLLIQSLRQLRITDWTPVTFSATFYTASASMTWTVGSGDQITYAFCIMGDTMFLAFDIETTTVGGTPDTTLQIAIPGGFKSAQQYKFPFRYSDNGTLGGGLGLIDAQGVVVKLQKNDASNWTAATNATYVAGMAIFEIQQG